MRVMQWSEVVPRERGWYWIKPNRRRAIPEELDGGFHFRTNAEPTVVLVCGPQPDQLFVPFPGITIPVADMPVFWSARIEEPIGHENPEFREDYDVR